MARYMDSYFDLRPDDMITASAALTSYPFTVNFWIKPVDGGTPGDYPQGIFLALYNTTNNQRFQFAISNVGGPILRFTAFTTVGAIASTSNFFTINEWNMCTGVASSATSRSVYLNNGTPGTNTTSSTPATPTRIVLGGAGTSGGATANYSGHIAEFAIWDVALNSNEITSLYRAAKASQIRPDNLITYIPLIRDSIDLQGLANTVNNRTTVESDHLRRYG